MNRAAADLLDAVLARANIVLWDVDVHGIFTLSTGRGLGLLGFKPEEMLGKSMFELYSGRPAMIDNLRRALAGEEFRATEELDGIYFDSCYTPLRDPGGTVTGVRGMGTVILNEELESPIHEQIDELRRCDLSLKEQAQQRQPVMQQLIESRARWKSVVEDAPDHILIVDCKGTIEYINHPVLPLVRADVEGRSIYDFVAAEFHTRMREVLVGVFKTGESLIVEMGALGPHGSHAWYSCRFGPVKVGDEIVAVSAVARDITRRVESEEQLRRRQAELTHVARLSTLGEMAATLAHELNQPLANIANYAGTCARQLQSGAADVDEVVRTAQLIGRLAIGAGDTIGRIRDFVRKKELAFDEISLNDVVPEAIELAAPEAKRQNVKLVVRADESLPPVVGDRIQLQQVLLNLIFNALEAMHETPPGRRRVTIATARHSDGTAQFSVSDNGMGLPEDFAEWIFEPFRSSKSEGIGMGLSICHTIVKLHGGQLSAERQAGGGATFQVTLPLASGDVVHGT